MKLMPGETWLLESYLSAWLNGDRREGTATEFVASEMIIRDSWGLTVKTLKNVCGNWEVQVLRDLFGTAHRLIADGQLGVTLPSTGAALNRTPLVQELESERTEDGLTESLERNRDFRPRRAIASLRNKGFEVGVHTPVTTSSRRNSDEPQTLFVSGA